MKREKAANHLDEMQKLKLMRLEGTGFWLAFWGLTAAVVVQCLLGTTLREIAGEIVVLALASVYIVFACLRSGLWATGCTPDRRTNVKFSLIAAFVLGAVLTARALYVAHMQVHTQTALLILAMMAAVFVACLAVLEGMRSFCRRRHDALEDQEEKDS